MWHCGRWKKKLGRCLPKEYPHKTMHKFERSRKTKKVNNNDNDGQRVIARVTLTH